MANKFEIANFNLFEFSKRFWDMFGDTTPKDVSIPQKDANGNIVNYLSPNRAKFKQQIWDDVGGALGQLNRTVYVDSDNGDDTDDGLSYATAFKTIKKAIDTYGVSGGNLEVQLRGNADHIIDEHIYTNNVNIHIIKNDGNGVIVQDGYEDGYGNAGYGIILKNAAIRFSRVTIKTANKVNADVGHAYDQGVVRRNTENTTVFLYVCNLQIGDLPMIRRGYNDPHIDIYLRSCSIDCVGANNDSYLIHNETGDYRVSQSGVTLNTKIDNSTNLTWNDLLTNITKDSNGVPRAVISNIIL